MACGSSRSKTSTVLRCASGASQLQPVEARAREWAQSHLYTIVTLLKSSRGAGHFILSSSIAFTTV